MQTLLENAKKLDCAVTQMAYLQKLETCSPFMGRLLCKDVALLQQTLVNIGQSYHLADMQRFLASHEIDDESSLKKALRQLRSHVLARLIIRDLNGLADLAEVMQTTTQLAEIAIQTAVRYLYQWQVNADGEPQDAQGNIQTFIVIGMGKLGGAELNVSSDVDLIFAYGFDGETTNENKLSNQQFFTRLAKKFIAALDEVTEDGFVFRVDMRLRPFGSEGALVSNLEALEQYYQNHGREWERYAWIKGREITGNNAVTQMLKPFVYRKYLDYGAFASMRDLKIQIQRDINAKTAQNNGQDNIKLGRGGIREIEFIAQVFQLIRGGQDSGLRIRPTLKTLQLLQEKDILQPTVVESLTAAYVFLRNLEHRLMYVEDQQTQVLPMQADAQQRIALAMNFAQWPDLIHVLNQHRVVVQQHFDAIFSERKIAASANQLLTEAQLVWEGAASAEQSQAKLTAMGFDDVTAILNRITMLHQGHRYRQLPELSRQRLNSLMPLLIQSASEQANADVALIRTMDFLESICRRASYLALMTEYPQALNLVVRLCAASSWCAQYLTQHPIVLDELLDEAQLFAPPDFNKLAQELAQTMQELANDTEQQMDAMRRFKHAQVFRYAAKDIVGQLPLTLLSDYLSQLADVIIDSALKTIWQYLNVPFSKPRHREQPSFAVIGYGKLGSRELGYASDLDIIFLFDDQVENAAEIYAKFAQRINNWFNTLTGAGVLYETDLQLRPDGNSGLLVSSVEAFRDYQLNRAWTWEHQALTRARFVAGDANIAQAFNKIRQEVIVKVAETAQLDPAKLKKEVREMREKMRGSAHFNESKFDLKQSAGGIIDVEFIVQYLVLTYASTHPELAENIGNIALLERLGKLNIIDAQLAEQAAAAYLEYRRLQHADRLQGELQPKVDSGLVQTHAAAVKQLWQQVLVS